MNAKLSLRQREKQRKALVTGSAALIDRLKESNEALIEADKALAEAARTIRRLKWAVAASASVAAALGVTLANWVLA